MDIDHIAQLLHIEEKSRNHPSLKAIHQLVMKELERDHNEQAKKELEDINNKEAKEKVAKEAEANRRATAEALRVKQEEEAGRKRSLEGQKALDLGAQAEATRKADADRRIQEARDKTNKRTPPPAEPTVEEENEEEKELELERKV